MLAGYHGPLEGPVPKSGLYFLPFPVVDNHSFSCPHFYGNDDMSSTPLTSLGLMDSLTSFVKWDGWMDSLLPDSNCYGNNLNLIPL